VTNQCGVSNVLQIWYNLSQEEIKMTPMFDYKVASKNLRISESIVGKLEKEAKSEFPNDAMLKELHILRALKAYARLNK
jgi:hypothetical protein